MVEKSQVTGLSLNNFQNYHLQLPPPYNTIIIGGAKQLLVHDPKTFIGSDREDELISGVPEFFQSWPKSDVVGWEGQDPAQLAIETDKGGCWTGGKCHRMKRRVLD